MSDHPSRATTEAWERHVGSPVDAEALRPMLSAGNLARTFHEAALEAGSRPALTIAGESATYNELDAAAARLGGWLAARGIDADDRVLLAGPNSLAFVIAYLAVLRAGAIAVLAGSGLTERELAQQLAGSGATAAFAGGEARERLELLLPDVWSLDGDLGLGEPLEPPDRDGSSTAVLIYTSGTTGVPKGAALSHANLLASLRAIMLAWRWRDSDALVHTLPLSHQHGLTGLHATLAAGARAVIHASLDPARLAETIAAERATVLFAVPAVYERVLGWQDATAADFSSLRLATCGSAPLSPALWQRVAALLGQEPLERYGTTESGLVVSNPYDGPRKPGAVGLPLPGIEVAIADPDGCALPAGVEGEILLRGPQVFAHYWEDEQATREAFHAGGWFRSGDLGRVDPADGYLSITGRLKELIISGGLNVYPREVELVLESHPSVERAAVVGLPSKRWGEEVVALVVPEAGSGLDERELAAHARDALAPYKRPKAILAAEALPLTALGKLRRSELAELAARLRSSAETVDEPFGV
jgi:malonyl-CoA/methylmalonyl-CoA synthetase